VIRPIAAGSCRFPRPVFVCCLVIFFLIVTFTVSGQSVESILGRSGFSDTQKASLIEFFAETDNADIPSELLLPKLEEGIAKGKTAAKVINALDRERNSLRKARSLILSVKGGEKLLSDRASWARAANLLASGISEGEIKDLVFACRSRTEEFRSASYLYIAAKQWGLAQESAFDLTSALLDSSISGNNFLGLIDLLTNGRRRRIAPEELVQRIQRNLQHVNTIEELEKWIY